MSQPYFAKRLALSLGLLALGAAMAWTVSLSLLQSAAINAGALPQPGSPIAGDGYQTNPLWQAAKTLQTLANTTGVVGALLLVAYGAVDYYGTPEVEA